MILYQNQVINLKTYDEPAIFLGFDEKNTNNIWAICISKDDKPEIDWFLESNIDYYHVKTNNKATPKGRVIFFGKYVDKANILPIYDESSPPSTKEQTELFNYIVELYNKYKKNDKTNDTTTSN